VPFILHYSQCDAAARGSGNIFYAVSPRGHQWHPATAFSTRDGAFAAAVRSLTKHRAALDRVAHALLEKETLVREEVDTLLSDIQVESTSSESVGVSQVVSIASE